jgi:hypothetical protein
MKFTSSTNQSSGFDNSSDYTKCIMQTSFSFINNQLIASSDQNADSVDILDSSYFHNFRVIRH